MSVVLFRPDLVKSTRILSVNILDLVSPRGGAVFAFRLEDDNLWEEIYREWEKLRREPEYRVVVSERIVYGEIVPPEGDWRVVIIGLSPEALNFLTLLIHRRCNFGFSDRRGSRVFFIGWPCSRDRLRSLLDVFLSTVGWKK